MHLSSIESGSFGISRVCSFSNEFRPSVIHFAALLGVYIPLHLLSYWLSSNPSLVAKYRSQVHELRW